MTGNVHLAVDVEVARTRQIEASLLSKRHISVNIHCGVSQIEETVARCSDIGFFSLRPILLSDDAEGLEIESAVLANRNLDAGITVLFYAIYASESGSVDYEIPHGERSLFAKAEFGTAVIVISFIAIFVNICLERNAIGGKSRCHGDVGIVSHGDFVGKRFK